MLTRSKKSLLLAAALLVPATSFAQEKTDAPVKADVPVAEVVLEEIVVKKADGADSKKTETTTSKTGNEGAGGKVSVEFSDEIQMIEIDGDDVPENINIILQKLKGLEAASKGKDGQSTVMSFSLNAAAAEAAGDLKDLKVKSGKMMKIIDRSTKRVKGENGGQEIRILYNVNPDEAQMRMLRGNAARLKSLTDAMKDLDGTISIYTSPKSAFDADAKPKVVTNSQIRIIGPDGKEQEMRFQADGVNQKSLSKAIQEALKKSGKDLPDDVRKRVEEAVERAGKRSSMVLIPDTVVGNQKTGTMKAIDARDSEAASRSVEQKLDLILNRLEKMQQEIDALKK